MRMNALGTNGGSVAMAGPVLKRIRRLPPNAALVTRNWRREVISSLLLSARRALDSLADSHISAAAADVPGHRGVDVAIGGIGLRGEQRRCRHDLAGLAVAALRDLQVDPRLLDSLAGGSGADGLDGRDALAGHGGNRRYARARGLAVEMDGARAA